MAYTAWSVIAGEQPTAAKWNILGDNDASFNDGSGIVDFAILERHIGPTAVTSEKLNSTIAFRAYLSADQSISSNVNTKVQFDTESYDKGGDYDNTTNHRFTAPIPGGYIFTAAWLIGNTTSGTQVRTKLYKNGAEFSMLNLIRTSSGGVSFAGSDVLLLDANDYIEVYAHHDDGSSRTILLGEGNTFFAGFAIGT